MTAPPAGGFRRLSAPEQHRGFQQLRRGRALHHLARLMEPPVEPVSCSGFAEAVVRHFDG